MGKVFTATLAIALAGTALPLASLIAPAAAQAPAATSRAIVDRAVKALGGAERIAKVRNITQIGYAQYAWLQGAEEISGSPHAPQKQAAFNDMRRVVDLEHDRYQVTGRNFLQFPFLAANAYNFQPVDQRLDGEIAYDAIGASMFGGPSGGPGRRVGESYGVGGPDGARWRRIQMLHNPIALARALMDPATTLSGPRTEGKYVVVDATIARAGKVTVGFFAAGKYCQEYCKDLPAFVRWTMPNPNLGQITYTTWLTGYADIQGLMLPLATDTRMDWRDIETYKVFTDHYEIDGQIADLAVPAAIRDAKAPAMPAPKMEAEKVADHIWRFPTGTTAVEFADHITLYELTDYGPDNAMVKAVLAAARQLVPGKPVTQLIASHEHFDHISGMRQAVAEGLTIIGRRGSGEQYEEMIKHAAPDYPDDLARNPKPFKFLPVDEKLVLKDPTMELWVLWGRNNIHMADNIVAYAPAQKVIIEGDVATASYVWQFWPDNLRDTIDYYKLDVKMLSPVHTVDPQHPGALTMEQVDALVKGGTDRARAMCSEMQAKNVYVTGCPVWSKRY